MAPNETSHIAAPPVANIRQLLTEAIVLGVISVPIGVALTYLGVALVTAGVRADDVPYLIQFRVSGITLAYTVAIAAASSLVFGLAPAWQLSRVDLNSALREGGRTGGGGARMRGRNLLVVVEVALALVLLVGASLFVRSFLNIQLTSAGFDPSPILTLRVFLPGERYESADAKTHRIEDVLTRIERLPAVRAAGASNLIPLDGGGTESRVVVDGVASEAGREPSVFFAGVSRRFFETLDIPLIRGRGFTDAESQLASPVAIVNVSFARRFLDRSSPGIEPAPGQPALGGASDLGAIDAIGRRVQLLGIDSAPWLTIVGVVPDFMVDEIDDNTPGQPAVFATYPHQATANTGIIVRTSGVGAPADLTSAIRAAIRESDPGVPVFAVSSLVEVRGKGLWQYKLFSWMFSIFGGLALLLGSAGVYGVLSYAVSQRTRELGVRIALGANRSDVLKLTVGQGLRLVAMGVGAGVLGAAGVTRIIGSLLYNVEPTDPASFVAVIALLAGVGLLASYLPARRASRIDPVVALRND